MSVRWEDENIFIISFNTQIFPSLEKYVFICIDLSSIFSKKLLKYFNLMITNSFKSK